MQPMRAKNRVTVMAGVALLAVVVGGFALWQSRKSAESKPNTNTVAMTDNTATAASTTPQTQTTVPSATAGASATPSTPAQTDGSLAAAGTATKLPTTYVVQPGDTLSTISMKFYNSDKYYGDIEAANELEDANHLMAGQTLKIPELPSVATATQGQ